MKTGPSPNAYFTPGALVFLALGFLLLSPDSVQGSNEEMTFSRCVEQYQDNSSDWESAMCFYRVARYNARLDEALQLVSSRSEQDPSNPNLILVLGFLEKDLDRREQLSREALDLFSQQGNVSGTLKALDALWWVCQDQDRAAEAEELIAAMEEALHETDDPEDHARVALVKARHLFEVKKDFAGTRNELLSSQHLLSPESSYRLRHRFLNMMGRSHFELGLPDKAYRFFSDAAALAATEKDSLDEIQASRNMIAALRDQFDETSDSEDHDHAIRVAREMLKQARATDLVETTVPSLLVLGDLLRGEEALGLYEECVQYAGQFGLATDERTCRLRIVTHRAKSNPEEALASLERIRSELPASLDPLEAAYAALNEIRVVWAAGSNQKAWEEYERALNTIENIRDLQERDFGRARSFAAWASAYSWLAGRLLDLYKTRGSAEDLEKAFEVGERMRARMLLDIFETMNATPQDTPELEDRRADLRTILSERNRLQHAVRSASTNEAELLERLDELHNEERILRGTISQLSGRFAGLERPDFPSIREVQQAMLSREALLIFQLAPIQSPFEEFAGGAWLVVITQKDTQVHRLGDGYQIGKKAKLLSDLLEQGQPVGPLTVRLHQDLLAKGLDKLPPEVTDLVLIPDRMLHRIPLAILRSSEDAAPLGSRYRITRIPSATLWLQNWRESTAPAPPTLQPALIVADPESDLLSSRRADSEQDVEENGSLIRATYGELPFAEQEGWSIRRHLGQATEMLVGTAASERALKLMALDRFAILHIAAHAISDEQRPDRAGIVLTPDSETQGENGDLNDGILEFNEIVDLGFAGRTIVLSTCHSARGEILRGEGVFDLARAFFQAGARAVVGSLWRLEDRATARFFDDFYRHLARGASLSEALHRAQRDQIANGMPPSAWAGIVVIGDGSLVPFPDRNGRHHPGWVILVALVILTLAAVIAARRTG